MVGHISDDDKEFAKKLFEEFKTVESIPLIP